MNKSSENIHNLAAMKRYKIFTKLFLSYTSVVLLALMVLSSIFYVLISDVLLQRTLDQLSSVNFLKKQLVENYFSWSGQNLKELQLENKFLNIYDELVQTPADNVQRMNDLTEIDSIRRLYDFENLFLFDAQNKQLYSTGNRPFSDDILKHVNTVIQQDANHVHLLDVSHLSPEKITWVYYYVPIVKKGQRVGMVLVQE